MSKRRSHQPNILFLMADQMRADVLDPDHPCLTPNLDRLAARGVRFSRAFTPNAICSPARASLMTGLLPHNHGVLTVTHTMDRDQLLLRTGHPHWAQKLQAAGYRTGYFGKWHVEEHRPLSDFGWETCAETGHGPFNSELVEHKKMELQGENPPDPTFLVSAYYDGTNGYHPSIFYGVTDEPPETRNMGIITSLALDYLDKVLEQDAPWCCFASVPEPHDPFICGQKAFDLYDVDTLPLSPNVHDELAGRPGIYRKASRIWANLTDRDRRRAAACYFASITEIDAQFGRILDRVEQAGQLDDTIVVFTTDHGELLGSHGLYCKNFMAAEEIYNIPLIVAGPGIAQNVVTKARVGSHDLCPTLLELAGSEPFDVPDSASFASLLPNPLAREPEFTTGFAEYFGGRMLLTQRIVWDGGWKFVFNGFDFDELYNLDDDPYEMNNLAEHADCQDQLKAMTAHMWRTVRDTNDRTLYNSHYPIMRVAPYGPMILTDD